MATDRETLKGYFAAGKIPLEAHFAQLVNDAINQKDDNIWKDSADTPINIRAVVKPPSPTGQGGDPAHKALQFFKAGDKETKPKWGIELASREDPNAGDTATINGLNITGPDKKTRLFIDEAKGFMGVNTFQPKARLQISDGDLLLWNTKKNASLHLRSDDYGNAYINNMNGFVSNGSEGNVGLHITGQNAIYFRTGSEGGSGKVQMYVTNNNGGAIYALNNVVLQDPDEITETSDGNFLMFYHKEKDGPVHQWRIRHMGKAQRNNALEIWEYKDSSLAAARLVILEGGNVGIGRVDPSSTLDIKNSTSLGTNAGETQPMLRLNGNINNNGYLMFFHRRHTNGNDWTTGELRIQRQVDNSPMHYISFKGEPGSKSAFEIGYNQTSLFTIESSGKVGIGTTSPIDELEVKGTIKAAESYKFPDNTEQKTAIIFKTGVESVSGQQNNPLRTGTGIRTYTKEITYTGAFTKPPSIILAIRYLDTDQGKNTRVKLASESVTKDGFTLKIETWDDSLVYGVVATWLALGN